MRSRFITAERRKLPKWPVALAVFGSAGGIVGLKFLGYLLRRGELTERGMYHPEAYLTGFSVQFHQMLLPLIVAAMVAFAFFVEEEHNGWKVLVVQPVSRIKIFVVKAALIYACLLGLLVSLGVGYLITGVFLFESGVDPEPLAMYLLSACIFLAPVFAVQLFLSVLLPKPMASLGLCLGGMLIGALAAGGWTWGWPWFYTGMVGLPITSETSTYVLRALLLTAAIFTAATASFCRKEY